MIIKNNNKSYGKLLIDLSYDGGAEQYPESGSVIYSQGEPADSIYFIHDGEIRISTVSAHGKEAVVAILRAGDFFGEGCLAGQEVRIATAAALTDSSIVRVERATIVRVLQENRAAAGAFTSHLLARNIRMEADLIDQLFNSSERRLARLLLLLANFGKEGAPQPIIGEISQETLAEMIGSTRSRVARFMNKFKRLGFISDNGRIEVHNSLLSVVLRDNLHDLAITDEDDAPSPQG